MSQDGELNRVLDPRRMRIALSAFYITLAVLLFSGLYFVADHIKTRAIPVGGIVLGTTYSQYLLGDPVSFSVTNNYNSKIYITNQCPGEPLAVYRQTNGTWVRLHGTANAEDCQDEQRQVGIPSNSKVTLSLAPWHSLFNQAGKYRLVAIIDGYSSLPYVDFEVVAPPTAITSPTNSTILRDFLNSTNSIGEFEANPLLAPQTSATRTTNPVAKPAAKTITVHVTTAGKYDLNSISLNAGDSIKFVYSAPYGDEVQTVFSAISPTTTGLSSVTLDRENTTRIKTFSTAGRWSFWALDHSGNTVVLTVN
ncbi:MAG: hypothetical protein WC498_00970 [Candidatus Saccharimonadales bacterium]